ncbi:MAG: hypothetical protein AAGA50_13995 [Pseudomonadota bacterium]
MKDRIFMTGQVDPSILEKWFELVNRWQDVEADLRVTLEQLATDDPEREAKSKLAQEEFRKIKREMDALIDTAKPSKNSGTPGFIAGSINISKT